MGLHLTDPNRNLWLFYALAAAIFTLTLAILLPPIMGPDEGSHYVRADEISLGEPLASRITPTVAGGHIDLGIMDAIGRFYPLAQNPNLQVTRAMFAPIPWGRTSLWSFPNTAVYPPPFYLPMAAAIKLGKALGFDVLRTQRLARLCNILASVVLATIAVALAQRGAIWLLALLLLPSSALLMSAMTQDGLILASAAMAGSLTVRLQRPGSAWRAELLLLCILLANLAMCRPPYAALALMPLATTTPPRPVRWLASAATLAAASLWYAYCAIFVFVSVDQSYQAHAGTQLLQSLEHPWRLVPLMANTLWLHFSQDYAGWFITTFRDPGIYHGLAWAILALAFLAMRAGQIGTRTPGARAILSALLLSATGIFAIQYLTWTPVGATSINGVQGRYFLPLAMMLVTLQSKPASARPGWAGWAALPVILFPAVSIAVTIHDLLLRYYLPLHD